MLDKPGQVAVNRPMAGKSRPLTLIAAAMLMAACAGNDVDRQITRLEKQIDELDRRVADLERVRAKEPRSGQAPCIDPQAIHAEIRSLWARRDALSLKYTEAHPDVRHIDKQIERLQQRLRTVEETDATCYDTSPAGRD